MRSLEEARARWQITTKHAANLDDLKRSVRSNEEGKLGEIGLRSVCWKTFLLFQTTEVTGWSRILIDSRSAYTSLKDHFLRYIENPNELGSALDPLDDDRHSPWNALRQDEEIRAEIFQDVERCMPEEPYFRKADTQRLMLDILFIFCKINQDTGYRQGMHELLAPLLWVVEQDAIAPGSSDIASPETEDSMLKQTLDSAYIEHDAFTLFSLVMRTAKSFYELGEPERRLGTPPKGSGSHPQVISPIVERSKQIHEIYLARLDPALATHLTEIEVLPQIFLIRWIRLLFGREFPFDQLLTLWDVIFAEDPALDLVDMVCVAMLLRIRWQLIEANYSVALMLLLKYPPPSPPHGPQSFVDDALYLKEHFNEAGGSHIINKYSGKLPSYQSSEPRPSTPLAQPASPLQRLARTKRPLPSPARFLQQQGGMEALLYGAAKGVFDRGEKLGINQAVRDAVEEAKRNMQGTSSPKSSSTSSRADSRWSLDEGRPVLSAKAHIAGMNRRNKQLAQVLGQAMSDLRAVSILESADKDDYIKAMDLAIAKVDFVKVYLEDATMPLPSDEPAPLTKARIVSPSHSRTSSADPPNPQHPIVSDGTHDPEPQADAAITVEPNPVTTPAHEPASAQVPAVSAPPIEASQLPEQQSTDSPLEELLQARPKAPVPTRSTIANSSFSWMLDDSPISASPRASSPKAPSQFLKSERKTNSGAGREKSAFLFGEDAESRSSSSRPSLLDDEAEGFKLGTIKSRDK